MKKILFPLLITQSLVAQELVQTDFEKGYIQDGKKISVWQYFNAKKEPELVINHTTGKVMFIKKDTSEYFIFRNGQWIASKVDVRPLPIEGSQKFLTSILKRLNYSDILSSPFENDNIVLTFEVDSLGTPKNFLVSHGKNEKQNSELLMIMTAENQSWIPARIGSKRFSTRFEVDIVLRGAKNRNDAVEFDSPDAKYLGAVVLSRERYVLDEKMYLEGYILDENSYVVVDKKPQFPGGPDVLTKFLKSNLKYPASAKDLGLEGRLLTGFFVETNGTATEPKVLVTFDITRDKGCEKAALETVGKIQTWIPAQRRGKSVRSEMTLPVTFKLSE